MWLSPLTHCLKPVKGLIQSEPWVAKIERLKPWSSGAKLSVLFQLSEVTALSLECLQNDLFGSREYLHVHVSVKYYEQIFMFTLTHYKFGYCTSIGGRNQSCNRALPLIVFLGMTGNNVIMFLLGTTANIL